MPRTCLQILRKRQTKYSWDYEDIYKQYSRDAKKWSMVGDRSPTRETNDIFFLLEDRELI